MFGVGIVGLPNVGTSTLFNAITGAQVEAANYPFATIDRNVGVVAVPDARLSVLAGIFAKGGRVPGLVPTTVEFVDIAGLVRGAHRGEGLGNQFLGHIRDVAAVAHVVRCFDDPDVVHVTGRVDPIADIETIETELALADLATLERREERLRRGMKAGHGDEADSLAQVEALREAVAAGQQARATGLPVPSDLRLLTAKPVVFVCNVSEDDVAEGNPDVERVRARAAAEGAAVVTIAAKIEQELGELDADEAAAFLAELGLTQRGLDRLVAKSYEVLALETFLTANEREVTAWAVPRGTRAQQAAGKVHSDFERGFIRAEVIAFERLAEAGSVAAARARGWLRTEGRDYVVAEGDVIHFLFNV